MEVIHFDINNTPKLDEQINLCLGFFDGVHIGHAKLIKAAKLSKGKVGVLSFESRPRPGSKNRVITKVEDKIEIFKNLGVDYLLLLKVDQELMDTPYLDFINKCLKKINPHILVMGDDFTFGKDRLGTPLVLKAYFKCKVLSLKRIAHKKISSTDIKALIEDGEIETANKLMKREYMITNSPRKGFGKGRELGFNTVNVPIGNEYVVPKYGVYLTNNLINGVWVYGLTNVGVHPTINKLTEPIIEAHLLNYSTYEEIKEPVKVKFIKFIRPEKHFSSVDTLQKQVLGDIARIKKYLHMK